ncbi:hypothetical protein BpHYR1_038424 [Brachionus plicatilis]|uniref:Uncharacterized protein n=1 Tax=Brachionus plicatilis TaxID=10195 RepID=A0A3M7PZR0_BRAPC|nr:hypothetical protein BpHYR1_038424 [Brachionus plicatilis]
MESTLNFHAFGFYRSKKAQKLTKLYHFKGGDSDKKSKISNLWNFITFEARGVTNGSNSRVRGPLQHTFYLSRKTQQIKKYAPLKKSKKRIFRHLSLKKI